MKKTFSLLLCLLFLSGCFFTMGLDNISEKYYVHFSENDELIAFGQTKSDGRILFIGKKYIYAIDKKYSAELKQILNNTLGIDYAVFNWGHSYDKSQGFYKMGIVNKNNDNSSCFDMVAINDNLSETQKSELKKMQFSEEVYEISNRNPLTYHSLGKRNLFPRKKLCLKDIKIYQNNTDIPQEYVLKNKIEVFLLQARKDKAGLNSTAANVLLPFALVADIVLFPVSSALACKDAYHGCMPE